MVALPNAPWSSLVTVSGLNQGTRWQNKLHFTYPTGTSITFTQLAALATGVENAWIANIAPLCNTNVTMTNITAIDLNSRTGPNFNISPTTAPPGTRAGVPLTVQNALTASWVIQSRYRGGHPRTYFPGGVQADTLSGHQWTTAFISVAQSGFEAFRVALNGITSGTITFTFVMLSYFSGSHELPGQPPPPPVLRPIPVPFAINGVVVHPRIDTQRRRLGKEVP